MKQKIYVLGVISAMIVFAGTIFKINHYPGAAILIITGIASLVLLFLPLALTNHYRANGNGKSLLLHIVTYITCLVVFTAMLFKLMHWPYAGLLLTVALPFPYVVFLPVFIGVTSKDSNFNIYNTAFVLFLLALNSVFSGLLALNVTSERVDDSYQLSRNYINQQKGLSVLSGNDSKSAISVKIDEVKKVVNACQSRVLELDGKTLEVWKHDPGHLLRPDLRGSVATGLGKEGKKSVMKLQSEIEELIKIMTATPGYETLAENANAILNFKVTPSENDDWYAQVFNDFLAWVLIYLDGLESNLSFIKASSSATGAPV
jgi:hypothetical protein